MTQANDFYIIYNRKLNHKIAATSMTRNHIIECAVEELDKSGASLEDMAGIDMIESIDDDGHETLKSSRQLSDTEMLHYSVLKLSDDGRTFEIFERPTQTEEFLSRAKRHNITREAKELVSDYDAAEKRHQTWREINAY